MVLLGMHLDEQCRSHSEFLQASVDAILKENKTYSDLVFVTRDDRYKKMLLLLLFVKLSKAYLFACKFIIFFIYRYRPPA